jgi:hypothetical protein
MLAELGHRDAAQRQRGRIIAQRDVLEGAERIAGGEGACGSGDEGIHCREATSPAPAVERPAIYLAAATTTQYFRDVATVVNAGGPLDKAKLVEVMSRYGLALAVPSRSAAAPGA